MCWDPCALSPSVERTAREHLWEAGGLLGPEDSPCWHRLACRLSPLPPSAILTRSPDSPLASWARAFQTCWSLYQKHFPSVHIPHTPPIEKENLGSCRESFWLQFKPVSLQGSWWLPA